MRGKYAEERPFLPLVSLPRPGGYCRSDGAAQAREREQHMLPWQFPQPPSTRNDVDVTTAGPATSSSQPSAQSSASSPDAPIAHVLSLGSLCCTATCRKQSPVQCKTGQCGPPGWLVAAPGSLRHDLALREASGEPADRCPSRLLVDTGTARFMEAHGLRVCKPHRVRTSDEQNPCRSETHA